jgi:UDP-N-acetylmuramyl pentapeptide phosphotransferase/UDP-N-acetylglucosamine-1-phosphate transferase
MKLAGIILIVIGLIAVCYQYIPITETKQDAQIGSLNISHQETHNVPIPPIVGGICIVAGVVALVAGGRTNS